MESSCRESQPWTSSSYDRNVTLRLVQLGRAKQPFLAAEWSQSSLCQADGPGAFGICLIRIALRGEAGAVALVQLRSTDGQLAGLLRKR
ncbi:uncharacterized protein LOC116660763 isoform X2 [Camelus ferus]|uniref:Uncharacterized protein LOC116660763 isoform X2 n=2 Tax=Camelus TaxID=9836 RepID=A0A8B8SBI9_CAMFR|nr:uncharacterized protein LOC116660763 isoform X2 [Camelus ferus]XP_045369281.1 uncharacterized protein LOC123615547 isoform X3 [Camelus bactrianus]